MEEDLKAGTVLGGYRIIRSLGSGGMGRVYEAEHLALGVRRALKVFSARTRPAEELAAGFVAEGRVLANLAHDRVVRIHDLAVDGETGLSYFAMDLVLSPDGTPRTLEDARRRGLDEARAAGWFADICEALDYIHARGIVHCDLKLENLLIGPDGRVVISDFGISRIFEGDLRERVRQPVASPAAIGRLAGGTPRYIAPELLAASGAEPGPASDAWSLGVLTFRLLTGFWFDDAPRAKSLALLDEFDLPWRAVVAGLCAADPKARLVNGGLRGWATRLSTDGPRRRGLLVAGGLLAAAALALAAGALFRGPRADAPVACALRPDAPNWSDWRAGRFARLDATLLDGRAKEDGDLAFVLGLSVERRASYLSYGKRWRDGLLEKMDALIAAEAATEGATGLTPAQAFVVAGEIHRVRRAQAPYYAEFPDEIDRLLLLAKRFIADATKRQLHPEKRYMVIDPEWVYEIIEDELPFGRLDGRRVGAGDTEFQRTADVWIMRMIRGATLAAEASRALAGRGANAPAEARAAHEEKCALARRNFYEAYAMKPQRYAAAMRMIGVSHDDIPECRRWFETCQAFSFDDFCVWMNYAHCLALADGGRARLERLLDAAFETGRYDTWVPAFYVLVRWRIYAKYCGPERPLGADARAWAYEDEAVRARSLDVIRKYQAGEILARAPDMRRWAVTAVFAVVALLCGDEALADELAATIPAEDLKAVVSEAAAKGTSLYRRLVRRNDD